MGDLWALKGLFDEGKICGTFTSDFIFDPQVSFSFIEQGGGHMILICYPTEIDSLQHLF